MEDTARKRVTTLLVSVLALTLAVRPALAHVEYVTEESPGAGIEFAIDVLSEPLNAALVGGVGLLASVAVGGYLWVRPTIPDFEVLRSALAEYLVYVPWMLRLSLGLPLIGAGFAGYVFSPSVGFEQVGGYLPAVRLLLIGLGFFLLFGLATRVVAAVGLLSYGLTVALAPGAILAVEYVPGFLAIVLMGSGRPSADHLLNRVASASGTYYNRVDPVSNWARRVRDVVDPYTAYVPTILRVGLGSTFVLLGFGEKLMNPAPGVALANELGLPSLIPVSAEMWVLGAGLAEIAFGLLLIFGLFTRATAAGAFALFTVTLFALENDPVLAHITLFGMASAVFTLGAGPFSLDARLDRVSERLRGGTPA